MKNSPTKKIWAFVAAIAVLGSACSALDDTDETTRDDEGNIVEGGEISAFALNVGDCFTDLPIGEVETLEAVPCADEHGSEVYHLFDVTLDEFDAEAIDEQAATGCFDAFEPYVDASYETSFYDFTYLYPTEDSWRFGDDREIACLVVPYEGGTSTGTARGSGLTLELEQTSPDGDVVEESVFDVAVGDCILEVTDGTEVQDVQTVPCEQEHSFEAYYAFDVSVAEFDEDAILTEAGEQCIDAFNTFIGIDYFESIWDYTTLYPTEQSWANGDREVVCLVYPLDEVPTTGSAQGVGV